MNLQQLLDSVQAFADKPGNVSYDRGRLIAEIYSEIFEVEIHERKGNIWCVENEKEQPAWQWLTRRLGRFGQLARRILDYIPDDPLFISVEADVVDVLDEDPDEESKHSVNALESVQELMDDNLAGMTKVVYLTSDAGEGKTSLIDRLSRIQAEQYLKGEASWLLLPVKLGGRPFIRLDDVIVGTLSNRLRFPYYYYDSVLELVKRNAIVLALDGFEEMFIETRTGDAVSSLGNLVNQLDSSGKLLVAARSAYYNYRDFEAQAKLFQSIRTADVSFAEVSLRRWSKDQFIALAKKAGIEKEGKELFESIASRLNDEHPLLTRAILARRLIEEYKRSDDKEELIQSLAQATGEEYFDQFVARLVHREATEKWIDRSGLGERGDAAQPLLSLNEHHQILAAIAEEMWRSAVNSLNVDTLEDLTELIVDEELNQSPDVIRQARERITQHALLVQAEGSRLYQFDHEDFRSYYLGRYLAKLLLDRRSVELRTVLEVKTLPDMAVRVCVTLFRQEQEGDTKRIIDIISHLCDIGRAGQKASFLRANVGKLVLSIIEGSSHEKYVHAHSLYVGAEEIEKYKIRGVNFRNCVFERLIIVPENHKELKFEDCTIVHIVVRKEDSQTAYRSIVLDEGSLPSKVTVVERDREARHAEEHYYEPPSIQLALSHNGFDLQNAETVSVEDKITPEPDLEVQIVDRVLRYYQRSTSINENVFKKRLGTWWPNFEEKVLPDLIELGILNEVAYGGGGSQRRFRLSRGFENLERARRASKGDYNKLLQFLK